MREAALIRQKSRIRSWRIGDLTQCPTRAWNHYRIGWNSHPSERELVAKGHGISADVATRDERLGIDNFALTLAAQPRQNLGPDKFV